MVKKSLFFSLIFIFVFTLVLAGCSNSDSNGDNHDDSDSVGVVNENENENKSESESENNNYEVSTDPVTLKIFFDLAMPEDQFETLVNQPVKEKHPNITLVQINKTADLTLADLVAMGEIPDMIWASNVTMTKFSDLGIFYDIEPLMKKHNVDLARFNPVVLNALKAATNKGELYGLPMGIGFQPLFYNKDIFDKFGVDYPKDGMTWEETIDLARELTRTEDGVDYQGLLFSHVHYFGFPLGLNPVDAETGEATVNNDGWKKAFETTKSIKSIPGNEDYKGLIKKFFTEKTVAMMPNFSILNRFENLTEDDMNWDIAQHPYYADAPNISGSVDANILLISSTSEYKDQAMQVLQVTTSDEVQTIRIRSGKLTGLVMSDDMKAQFGADQPYLQGKNIESIFKNQYIEPPIRHLYYQDARKFVDEGWNEYMRDEKDLNTVLTEIDEKINQFVKAQQ